VFRTGGRIRVRIRGVRSSQMGVPDSGTTGPQLRMAGLSVAECSRPDARGSEAPNTGAMGDAADGLAPLATRRLEAIHNRLQAP